MRRLVSKSARYFVCGTVLNGALAWAFVGVWGKVAPGGRLYHNPRAGHPVAFYVDRRAGVEWVTGCGRPGTMIGRDPGGVRTYSGSPWWPAEAVTFDFRDFGVAAGWPLLSFSAWLTVEQVALPGDQGLENRQSIPWGMLLSGSTNGGWSERPAILPLRPLWSGILVNSLAYAVAAGAVVEGAAALRRRTRKNRGLCPACAYPAHGVSVCPECGHAHPVAVARIATRRRG